MSFPASFIGATTQYGGADLNLDRQHSSSSLLLNSPYSPPRLCFHRRLFVCKQDYAKTVRPICTKFGEQLARGPRKKGLDYCVNPDLDQHPGTFCRSFSIAVLAPAKRSHTGFGNSPKIGRLENLRLNLTIKGCLAAVMLTRRGQNCGLGPPPRPRQVGLSLASILLTQPQKCARPIQCQLIYLL